MKHSKPAGDTDILSYKKGDIKEIEAAIRLTKNNKAPGQNKITAEMLKVDTEMSAKCLAAFFSKVLKEEKVPEMRRIRIIVILSKKRGGGSDQL